MQEHRVIQVPLGFTETGKLLLEPILPLLQNGRGDEILYIPEIRTQYAFLRETLLNHLKDGAATLPRSLPLPNLLTFEARSLLGPEERVLVLQVLTHRHRDRLQALIPASGHLSIPYAQKILRLFDDLRTYRFSLDIEEVRKTVEEKLGTYPYVWDRTRQVLDFLQIYRGFLYEKNILDAVEAAVQTLEQGGPDFTTLLQGITTLLVDGWTYLTPLQAEIARRFLHQAHAREIQILAVVYDVPPIEGLTPAAQLFQELQKQGVPLQITTTGPISPPSPKAYAFASPEDEARFVAREIKTLLLSSSQGSPHKILITMPSVYGFEPTLSRAFLEYGLTYGRQFGPPVTQHPFVRFLLSALRVIQGDYMRLPMVDLFSSPYFKRFPEQDQLDRLTREYGLVGTRNQWQSFLLDSDPNTEPTLSLHTREILTQFLEWAVFWETPEERPLSTYLQHFREFIDRFTDLRHVEPLAVLEITAHALSTLDALGTLLEDPPLTADAFYDLLFTVLRNQRLPEPEVPPPEFPIQVVGFEQAYHIPHDILFVLNMDEHSYPQDTPDWLLLPDHVRKELGLPHRDMLFDQQELRLQAVLKSPRQALYVSYTAQKDDQPVLPSVFLDALNFESVSLRNDRESRILSPVEFAIFLGRKEGAGDRQKSRHELQEAFHHAMIEKRLRRRLENLNVTDLEDYAKCPRKFFYQRVLEIEMVEEPEPGVDFLKEGAWLHAVLQETFKTILKNGHLPSLEDQNSLYEHACETASRQLGIPPLWHRYLLKRYDEPFKKVMEDYRKAYEDSGFQVKAVEYRIEWDLPSGTHLKGRIDRVDVNPDGWFKIIDYKTSSFPSGKITLQKVERGEYLQLPLYWRFYTQKTGLRGDKMLYFGWSKNNDFKPIEFEAESLQEIIEVAIDRAEDIVRRIQNAEFPYEPLQPGLCLNCPYRLICPRTTQ